MKLTVLPFLLALFAFNSQAQSTWQDIYTIMNTKCNSSTCHGDSSSNQSFNVDDSPAELYATLINGTPVNPWAKDSSLNKLVVPGNAHLSFLMRKLAHCDTGPLSLVKPFEGQPMPEDSLTPPLPDNELELILTWILAGAPETAPFIDTLAGNPNICELPLSIKTISAGEVSFSLSPNPAANLLNISYSLKEPSSVIIELFDISGRTVETLLNEKQGSGSQKKSLKINSAVGIYFLRMTINEQYALVKKIIAQ